MENDNLRRDYISASEIGVYDFCALKWYLERNGLVEKINTVDMQKGKEEHEKLAEGIETEKKLSLLARALIFVALLILLYIIGVFLL